MAKKELKYGLKLWSTNVELVPAVVDAFRAGAFDFIELYSNPASSPDFGKLRPLSDMRVTIHTTHSHGFHEFIIRDEQKKIWEQTIRLADFFKSDVIVLHPGREHTLATFKENLALIDDERIHIENMAGLDIHGAPMFGQTLEELKEIAAIKPICFDFEKAVKAACYQKLDYKVYIGDTLRELRPDYFHISGGDSKIAVDQHLDLTAADFDVAWMKRTIENLNGDVRLVFETPKKNGIRNDIENIEYFRSL